MNLTTAQKQTLATHLNANTNLATLRVADGGGSSRNAVKVTVSALITP